MGKREVKGGNSTYRVHPVGSKGTTLDGTNHACERFIGWWIESTLTHNVRLQGIRECCAFQSLVRLV